LTYSFGRSRAPLTRRCNANTLPTTRGANFLLPPAVVFGRVRNCEHDSAVEQLVYVVGYKSLPSQKLPSALETVSEIET
jgi:hypothetical protein